MSLNRLLGFSLRLLLVGLLLCSALEAVSVGLQGFVTFVFSIWDSILYYGVPTAIVGLAGGVIFAKNPINALFCLIGVFINVILLLLSMRVEFLSMILLIVYIGAIAILFLFVIMLLNLRNLTYQAWVINSKTLALLTFFALGSIKLYTLLLSGIYLTSLYGLSQVRITIGNQVANNAKYYIQYGLNDVLLFSELLYSQHAPLFLLSGMILLASMIGAIVLAMSTIET